MTQVDTQKTLEALQYIVIDDRETESKELETELDRANLNWILIAHYLTLADAKKASSQTKFPDIDIAFVDGNMSRYSSNGFDGKMINTLLATDAPHVLRVGNSASFKQPVGSQIFIQKNYSDHDTLREIDRLARKRHR